MSDKSPSKENVIPSKTSTENPVAGAAGAKTADSKHPETKQADAKKPAVDEKTKAAGAAT